MQLNRSPFAQYFGLDGSPLNGGYLYFGVANQNPEVSPIAVYWDSEGTQPAAQPIRTLNGYPVRNGTVSDIYADSDYSHTVKDANGRLVFSKPVSSSVISAADLAFNPGGTGAVITDAETKMRQQVCIADKGIISDGTTDQTSEIIAALNDYSADSFRGFVNIPYNTKFNVPDVYSAIPLGIILDDESSINFGQPPGYKNTFKIMGGKNSANDDMQYIIIDGHHAAMTLCNLGYSGSSSGTNRYASILHGVNYNENKDIVTARQFLCSKAPSKNNWRYSIIAATSYLPALGLKWVAGVTTLIGTCVWYGSYYYIASSNGVTGATPPTHTVGTVSDGGVNWDFGGLYNNSRTEYYLDDDGEQGHLNPYGKVTHNITAGSKTFYHEYDNSTGNYTIRANSAGANAFKWTETNAFVALPKLAIGNVSAPDSSVHLNTGAFGYSLTFEASSGTSRKFQMGNTSAGLTIFDMTAGAVRVSWDGNGKMTNLPTYNNTTASAANVFVDSAGQFFRSTSSERFKTDVEDMAAHAADSVLSMRPVWYRSTCEADRNDWSWYGLLAEEVAQVDPRYVHWGYSEYKCVEVSPYVPARNAVIGEDGEILEAAQPEKSATYAEVPDTDSSLIPDGVAYERLVVPLIALVQRQQKQLEMLAEKIAALEGA